jgi:hypothetical protein
MMHGAQHHGFVSSASSDHQNLQRLYEGLQAFSLCDS